MPLDDKLAELPKADPLAAHTPKTGGAGICGGCLNRCWFHFPAAATNLSVLGLGETIIYRALTETLKLREYTLLADGRIAQTYDGALREVGMFADFTRQRMLESELRPDIGCSHPIYRRLAQIEAAKRPDELNA